MRKTNKFASKALAGMVALGMVAAAAQAGAESIPQVVQVVKVEGSAQYSTDGKTWQTLHQGDVLKSGAVIRTAERSLVDVTLGEPGASGGAATGPGLLNIPSGSGAGAGGGGGGGGGASDTETANIVRIFESTVLGVDKLTLERTGVDEVSETQLDLRAGQIMGNVKKLSAQSKYEIKLPNGVAGIRGSKYIWSSAGPGGTLDGDVRLAYVGLNGTVQVFDVPTRQKFDPGTGQVAAIPDSDYDQYMAIFNDMLSSAGGQQGQRIKFLDISCGHTCPVDAD